MRFIRLKIENFGGIRNADVEFGPGLNVLFGPNELGKSTLADAIRGALLLQSTSAAYQPWVRWGTDESPLVELTFQTEEQRYWRVKKTYAGARGKAEFAESRDGVSFSTLKTGRAVEGEIRKLLRWGIPEPGKGAGVKGMPQTFLTATLLPAQGDVGRVLACGLSSDLDESGKDSLTTALQAVATHPVFADVLKSVQSKVDEAFTSKGQKRHGKDSPWKKIKDAINEAQRRVDECRTTQVESDAVQQAIRQKNELLGRKRLEHQQAEEDYRSRQSHWDDRVKLQGELETAQRTLDEALQLRSQLQELQGAEIELAAELKQLTAERAQLQTREKQLAAERAAAQEQYDLASSDDSVAQRELKRVELQKDLLRLGSDEAAALGQQKRAARLQESHGRLKAVKETAQQSRSEMALAEAGIRDLTAEAAVLEDAAIWHHRQLAADRMREIAAAEQAVAEMQVRIDAKTSELERLEDELAAATLPTSDELKRLESLLRELQIAEAALKVGIAVAIQPHQEIQAAVSLDNGASQTRSIGAAEEILAEQRMEIDLPNVAKITIHGGKPEARQKLKTARKRWASEVQPALQAAGVDGFVSLLDARSDHDRKSVLAKRLDGEIQIAQSQLAAQAQALQALGDCGQLRQQHGQWTERLQGRDAGAIADCLRTFDAVPADQKSGAIQQRLRTCQDDLAKREFERRSSLASLEAAEAEDAHLVSAIQSEGEDANGFANVLDEAARQVAEIAAKRRSLEAQLEVFAGEAENPAANAKQQLDAARQALESNGKKMETLDGRLQQVQQQLAECRGRREAKQAESQRHDLPAAQQQTDSLAAQLKALPELTPAVTEEGLAAERAKLAELERAVRGLEVEVQTEKGRLQQVGGDVAAERYASSQEALESKHREEREMQLDFDAWRLLRETLVEVENDEAAHLGQAIVDPIAERFDELTSRRYGKLQLGPALETQGIEADGDSRAVSQLSVGAREQLSTILRLCLAEKLGSVLLLDDQLVQSDDARMEWFCEVLRSSGKNLQIVVLTCRPNDYLQPREIPGDIAYKDSAAGLIRAAKLEHLVRS